MLKIGIICAYEDGFKPLRSAKRDPTFDGFRGFGFGQGRQIYLLNNPDIECYIAYVPLCIRKRCFRRIVAYFISKDVKRILLDERLNHMRTFIPNALLSENKERFLKSLAPKIARKVLKSKGLFEEENRLAVIISDLTQENKKIIEEFSRNSRQVTLVMRNITAGRMFAATLMRETGTVVRVSGVVPKDSTVIWRDDFDLNLRILGQKLERIEVKIPRYQPLFDLEGVDTIALAEVICEHSKAEQLKFTRISCNKSKD